MKKMMMMIALAACAAAMTTGCKSIEVTRHGPKLATLTDTNGVARVALDAKGKPILLDGGWGVDYFQHWTWQEFDSLLAKTAEAELAINNYRSGADTNLVALVGSSLDGLTRLTVAVGDAYTKIAGGGAQADTVLKTSSRVIDYFRGKGGDVSKAAVAVDEAAKTLKVSDGSTCIECDADGVCTDCTP